MSHPDVDKVAFTGSTAVGKRIQKSIAGTKKKITLELGGKAANIVFDDAPIDQAVEGVVSGIYFNQGHVCCAGSRLLVQEGVAGTIVRKLRDRVQTLRVGDPLDKNTDVGAINSKMQLDKIKELVASGETEGAQRYTAPCALPTRGYFFAPTFFTGVSQSHRIAREEIFGPVLTIMTFRTPDEAIEKANNTMYGLSAGIWTDKGAKIFYMAAKLRAGVVWANTFNKFDAKLAVRRLQRAASGAKAAGKDCSRTWRSTEMATTKKPPARTSARPAAKNGAAKAPANGAPLALTVRKAFKMYVGGAFTRSESGRYFQVPESKASGDHGTTENVPLGSRKDTRDAVKIAHDAFPGWSKRIAANRGQILYRLAEMTDARRSELERSLEKAGVASADAKREVAATIDRIVAFAGWTDKYQSLFSSLNPVGGPHFDFTVPEPMGVVAIVAPRAPALLGLVSTILPVVTGGNTCVVLASEDDPRTAISFAECIATSDMPGGVINILTGKVSEMLPHLARHYEVAALDLHGVEAPLEKQAEELGAESVKRIRARHLTEAAWLDAEACESPRWIERFIELKTIWHPSGA